MALPAMNNPDDRIRWYELLLEADVADMEEVPLPAGYSFAFYREGDCEAWINIERSVGNFLCYEDAKDVWDWYYGDHAEELPRRLVFVVNPAGERVATAAAYFDTSGRDTSGSGWVLWVAVRRDEQGKGLSKPLVSHAVQVLKSLGYTHAKIPTETTTWVGVKVYLDLGFRPIEKNYIHSRDGWRIIKRLTNHPVLAELDAASDAEVLGLEETEDDDD